MPPGRMRARKPACWEGLVLLPHHPRRTLKPRRCHVCGLRRMVLLARRREEEQVEERDIEGLIHNRADRKQLGPGGATDSEQRAIKLHQSETEAIR